ncbi:cell division protein FtsK, partial [Treponema pallidum subsp. pallidum]
MERSPLPRIIALTFGTLLFVSAVLLTLSTFLPLFTLHRASHWFFVPGTLLYETYAFSSLLVPLLLLHTALLLFVGGRSLRAESALVAFPLLFITAVCGEHGLYALRRALAARSISPSTRGGIDIVCVLCLLALLGAELYAALIYGERCYVWFHARIPRDFIA